jgi:hypothetical protein
VILPWVTATAYKTGQPVTNGGRTYLAVDDHTSGATFAGDLAAHWTLEPVGVSAAAVTTFDQSGVLSVTTGTGRLTFQTAVTILGVVAAVNTAPTGAAILVDVNKNGSTIFTTQANRPSIAAAGFASATATPAVTAFAAGDYMTVDIDQVGSTVAGADLTVTIRYREA